MQLTHQQAIDLLGKAGVKDVQLVADDAADESYNPDEALRVIDDARVAFHRPAIEKEVKDATNAAAAGKFGALTRQNIAKATGIPNSELSKFDSDAEAIAYAFSKVKETLSGDQKTMQDAIEKERSEWSAKERALVEEWEGKLKSQIDRYHDRSIDDWIAENLKDAPLLNTADRATVAKLIKSELRNQYDLEYDESGKTTKVIDRESKLPAKNKAGNDNFSLKEYAEQALTPYGLWAKNMSQTDPAKALQEAARNGNTPPPPPKMDNTKDPLVAKREQLAQAGAALQR